MIMQTTTWSSPWSGKSHSARQCTTLPRRTTFCNILTGRATRMAPSVRPRPTHSPSSASTAQSMHATVDPPSACTATRIAVDPCGWLPDNEPIPFGDQFFWDFTNKDAADYFISSVSRPSFLPCLLACFLSPSPGRLILCCGAAMPPVEVTPQLSLSSCVRGLRHVARCCFIHIGGWLTLRPGCRRHVH